MQEYHKAYRPATLDEVMGQTEAVRILRGYIKANAIPHALMFCGPSGCGKTTLARIVKTYLGCGDSDFKEINATDSNGVEMVRQIRDKYLRYATSGKVRIYHLDEAHGLTKQAQNALLKMLEDTPKHVYFILSTTDPDTIIKTVHTRCAKIELKALGVAAMSQLIGEVATKAGVKLSQAVSDKLVEVAGGSARQALVDLEKIAGIKKEQDRIDALVPAKVESTAMSVVNGLMPWKGKPDWNATAHAIMECDEDLEKVRQTILTIAGKKLVAGGPGANRAFLIIVAFADPFWNSRKPGMLAAAWQVFGTK